MNDYGIVGLNPCVHCGFCLQTCPTYLATGDESDSPRGRIVLIKALLEGRLPPTEETVAHHIDRCLGCRACETVCPSGVEYGPALEHTRTLLAHTRPIPLAARFVNAVLAEARLRRPLLALARTARPVARALAGSSRLGFAMGMLGATAAWPDGRRDGGPALPGAKVGDDGPARHRLPNAKLSILFTGCIMEGLFAHVHRATQRTLTANGFEFSAVPRQVCCGALHAHSGQHTKALELARMNVAAFAAYPDAIVAVNSAGCAAMLKEYGRLLTGDPLESEAVALSGRVQDVCELLAEAGPREGAKIRLRVAYDPPCHLLHAQGIQEAPLRILNSVPGLECVQPRAAELCCGSAGTYSLTETVLSRAVLTQKTAALREVEPDLVASGNPGCIMQIGAGLAVHGSELRVVHPVEILDWSYQEAGVYDL